jgi:hypothetical protein
MNIELSFKGVSEFMKQNDDLINQIKDGGSTLTSLADRVEASRKEADQLAANMQQVPFQVAKNQDIKNKQAQLVAAIESTKGNIETYKDDPTMLGLYQTELSTLYQQLGNTYVADGVSKIIVFTQPEIDEIHNLLAQATLDAAARQNQATVLQAAVQIGKLALKVLVKLAA